jgi:serine/threonine-protein kinase RIO1
MVYLPGLELNDYLEQYKTEENQTNQWHDKYEMRDEIPEIPREVILELLMKLSKFYPKVISLNNDYHYYHNDISTGNIMYSRNEYYLIDFGRSSNKPNAPNFDILTVIDVFNTILSSIQYMTNNEDLKLIYKTYNNELDAFNKIRPRQPPAEMFEFKKTLFEKTLNEFIKIQNPSINEISGGKKNKTKKNKTKRKRHKKRHTKKHR